MIPIETAVLRPRKWLVILPFLLPLVLFVVLHNKERQPMPIVFLAILVGVLVVLLLVFAKRMIIIDNEGITSMHLIGAKQVAWNGIKKVYTKWERTGKSKTLYWYFEREAEKPFKFSTALYGRKDLRTLAEAITLKCDKAEIQPLIRDMAEGVFPWYLF